MPTNETSAFLGSSRPHVLMVTNHGIHDWSIDAGLPDTGGQNVYVNELSKTLVSLGFRVTIANRGGYPHPVSDAPRSGSVFRGEFQRIVYIEDHTRRFVRKEEMGPLTGELGMDLAARIRAEASGVDLIISHYWDGAKVAEAARRELNTAAPHVWIPHSLGLLKKEGTPPEEWAALALDERVEAEREILTRVDVVGCTSRAMQEVLKRQYRHDHCLFLPPCVDTERFDPETIVRDGRARDLLSRATGRSPELIARSPVVTEISRTDRTKRKDVLIRAFSRVVQRHPDAILAVTLDKNQQSLYNECVSLIDELGVGASVALLGSVWEYVPSLFGLTAVYCTPSIMEGFGMSIQEAAACKVPSVASRRVPFAVEYLLGEKPDPRICSEDGSTMEIGDGSIVVEPDSVAATAEAVNLLLDDPGRRKRMGERAYGITIPRFTWENATRSFLEAAGIPLPPKRRE